MSFFMQPSEPKHITFSNPWQRYGTAEAKRLDNVLDCVKIDNITEMNDTIMACATLATTKLRSKARDRGTVNTIPAWKVRLQRKLKEIEQDLSRVVESRRVGTEITMME